MQRLKESVPETPRQYRANHDRAGNHEDEFDNGIRQATDRADCKSEAHDETYHRTTPDPNNSVLGIGVASPQRLTPKLGGHAMRPDQRSERIIVFALATQPLTLHGPLQRKLEVTLTLSSWNRSSSTRLRSPDAMCSSLG